MRYLTESSPILRSISIKKEHDLYAMKESCVEEDIQYIVAMCYQVTQGVIQVMEAKFAAEPEVVFA